jgi:hypothetical protein
MLTKAKLICGELDNPQLTVPISMFGATAVEGHSRFMINQKASSATTDEAFKLSLDQGQ